MASSSGPPTIDTLPNEILRHIFGFLDVAPPSSSTSELRDEPRFSLTRAFDAPLKSSSCVSKRWRGASASFLFKHAQFIAIHQDGAKNMLIDQVKPFLKFITSHELSNDVESFTLIAPDGELLSNTSDGIYRPDCFASFWHLLFAIIDPTVLTLIASPESLGALTSCNVGMSDAWAFNTSCHYLRLEKPAPQSKIDLKPVEGIDIALIPDYVAPDIEHRTLGELEHLHAVTSKLFDIRNWTKFLLNEGSSIRGYATYEWWLRQPPSILEDLLGVSMLSDQPLISPSIRDLSFIGIFPMHSHFAALIEKFPLLDNLYIQLVPRNEILQDKKQMRQVEAEDLWMERNSCYAMLMRELFHSPPRENFQYLKTFESGDAADEAAWNMAVEYVKRAGNGWSIAGEGVFVRDPNYVRDGTGEDDEEELAPLLSVP